MNDLKNFETIKEHFVKYEPTAYLFPTMRCNLKCKMCCAEVPHLERFKSCDELSDENYINLIDELLYLGFKKFDISGGEPLFREELVFLLSQKIKKNNAKVQLVTNGTLLTEVLLKRDFIPEQFDFIAVSLDSPNSETYKQIRGSNTFHVVVEGIKELVKRGFVVGINMVYMNDNYNQIGDMFELAKNLGVSFVQILRYRPIGLNSIIMDKKECISLYSPIIKELTTIPEDLLIVVNVPQYIHSEIASNLRKQLRMSNNIIIKTDCFGGCGAFNGNIAITASGDVTGCVAMINEVDFYIGNVKIDSISSIINRGKIWINDIARRKATLQYDKICSRCASWVFCKGGCPVLAKQRTLDWENRDVCCIREY